MNQEKPSALQSILAGDDPLGLLAIKSPGQARSSEDEIALANFEAINAFIDEHGLLPGSTEGREPDLNEYTLEAHLEAFRESEAFLALLGPSDRHGLLGAAPIASALPTTMSEIIASDHRLLASGADGIFEMTHVAPQVPKAAPDDVAQRRPCEHFADYAPIFATIAADLKSGRRWTRRFASEGSIQPGAAFILNGITAYVESVNAPHRRGKETDARLRVIFENGTESNHLLRSFARVLYEDDNGRQIIESAPAVSGPLFTGEPEPGPEELVTGFIYVVESLSTDAAIADLRGRLYKIGFTTQDVEERVANAEADPTFLFASVRIVTTFQAVNLRASRLERLIHGFFGDARLNVTLHLGRPINPREWFVVPLELVREAIGRILDGTILNYRYDAISRKIVRR